jgi:hypothetical protein
MSGGWIKNRYLWIVPGLAIGLYASAEAGVNGLGIVPLLAFGIAPHLPVVLAFGQPHRQGQLAPRAVPLFNVLHHPVAPLALLGLGGAGVLPPIWFVGALAWLSHIMADWAKGDGLRTRDGYHRNGSIWNGGVSVPAALEPRPTFT